jgi:hypothetical protein
VQLENITAILKSPVLQMVQRSRYQREDLSRLKASGLLHGAGLLPALRVFCSSNSVNLIFLTLYFQFYHADNHKLKHKPALVTLRCAIIQLLVLSVTARLLVQSSLSTSSASPLDFHSKM